MEVGTVEIMIRQIARLLFVLFAFAPAWAQDSLGSDEANPVVAVPVFKVNSRTSAPVLLPADFTTFISNSCERKFQGKVEIALVVDAHGMARNMMFLKPAANDLDKLAILVAELDRFTAANQAGTSVAVGERIEITLQACIVTEADTSGRNAHRLRLGSIPEQMLRPYNDYPSKAIFAKNPHHFEGKTVAPNEKSDKVGGQVSAPIPIITPEAEYSDEARRKGVQGPCIVSLFVDSYGLPYDARVVRSIEPSLNEKALEAIDRYRFKPAMRDHIQPVPVMINVEVNFRL